MSTQTLVTGWRRQTAPGGTDLLVRAGGAVLASPALRPERSTASVVLTAAPRPGRPLADAVDRAVLALDVDLTPAADDLAAVAAEPALVQSIRAELRRGDRVLATSVTVSGPFPRIAFDAALEADDARALLALAGLAAPAETPLELLIELRPAGPAPQSGTVEVRVALQRLWAALVAAADADRTVGTSDLLDGLPQWLATDVVEVLAGPPEPAVVLPALHRAVRSILTEVGERWRVSAVEPWPMRVTGVAAAGVSAAQTVPLVIRGPLPPSLAVHLVSPDGPWVPPTASRPRNAALRLTDLQVVDAGRAVPLRAVLDARWAQRRPDLLWQSVALEDLTAATETTDRRPGPVLTGADVTGWPDRFEPRVFWYLPEFVVQLPAPAQPPDGAPFGFEVAADGGHTLTGEAGITATIAVTLAAVRPAGAEQQAKAAGCDTLRRVPFDLAGVVLGIPYRDEAATTAVQQIAADTIQAAEYLTAGSPPEQDGSDADLRLDDAVRATFRLTDQWARLAYGALSTPDFQTLAATLTVGGTTEGWRRRSRLPLRAVNGKRAALPLEATMVAAAGMRVLPPWVDHDRRPELVAGLDQTEPIVREFWSRSRVPGSRTTALSVPCATYGRFYRELISGVRTAIGCRPAFSLGEAPARTHEPVTVAAATGWASVLRSLVSPGRFLVVPTRMAVGRYPETDTDRAYRPRLVLCSTIDSRDPTAVRCVLAAGLEPDLPAWVRSAIRAELTEAHPEPILDWWPEGAGEPRLDWALPTGIDVESVLDASGLAVVLSCDLTGLLAVKALLERDGLRGSMSVTLPGGVVISSALEISTGAVTGPFAGGPVTVTGDPAVAVTLTNRTGRRMAVTALANAGQPVVWVDRVLAGGESCSVATAAASLPSTAALDVVHDVEDGHESLEETRAYIEDLRVAAVFVAAGDVPGGGLDVETRIFGRDDPTALRLSAAQRQQRREYLLPLTEFAADPVLTYRVTSIGDDGTRRVGEWLTWRLRTAGPLITVSAA